MDGKIRQFTDLIVWQKAHKLVILVYILTRSFPREEMYSLTDQLKRAVISITSNIAEGFGRQNYKEKIQFYYLAMGSLAEVQNQLIAARDIGYLKKQDFDRAFLLTIDVYKLLNAFITKSKSFLTNRSQKSKF